MHASNRADYQANGVMGLAKSLGRPPREVAQEIVDAADLGGVASIEIAGPGFLNLTLDDSFVAAGLEEVHGDVRLGVSEPSERHRVALDYSSPGVGKELHVGHLRGTVIGDSLARVLRFYGHEVIPRNHLGDWGTPFGMLIEQLCDLGVDASAQSFSVGDLDAFYKEARSKFDTDESFAERSRQRVVALQHRDEESLVLWRVLVGESIRHFGDVYRLLDIRLQPEDVAGESSYNDQLDAVVADLDGAGLLVEDDGALCVFPEGFLNREGDPLPLIVRKRDGGYGYAATDLAALRDRINRLGCDRLFYVVGAPQSQHFEMVFRVAQAAGWIPTSVVIAHIAFGSILGEDHKPLKTRSGETPRLVDLLDEAIERAGAALDERGASYEDSERAQLAETIGIGAVKYADLSTERMHDYVFDFDRMLSFEGDTGPYLAYAHARIRSIFRRHGTDGAAATARVVLAEPQERALALVLLRFTEALDATIEHYAPHRLAAYLFGLAQSFTSFYEHCPVLRAPDDETRESRLVLCDATARTLSIGLSLLGIAAPERM